MKMKMGEAIMVTDSKKRKAIHHHEELSVADDSKVGKEFKKYRDDLLNRVPASIKERFLEGGFGKWGKEWLPVLEIGPFDVEPGSVRDMWLDMFEESHKQEHVMKRLVYWYGVPYGNRGAYSFLNETQLVQYEEGKLKGYDQLPKTMLSKIAKTQELSKKEARLKRGLMEIEADMRRIKPERVKWMRRSFQENHETVAAKLKSLKWILGQLKKESVATAKQNKGKKQQASLLSFFGEKKKKRQTTIASFITNNNGGDASSLPTAREVKHECNKERNKSANVAVVVSPLLKDRDSFKESEAAFDTSYSKEERTDPLPCTQAGSTEEKALSSLTGDSRTSSTDDSRKNQASSLLDNIPTASASGATKHCGDNSGRNEEDRNGDGDDSTNSDNDDNDRAAVSSSQYNKSAYELLREKNIARNNARLKALGLITTDGDNHPQSKKKRQTTTKRKKARGDLPKVEALPKRRSSRLKNPVVTDRGITLEVHHENGVSNEESGLLDPKEEFTVSPLIEYQMATHQSSGAFSTMKTTTADNTSEGNAAVSTIRTLEPSETRLVPPSRLSIYSLQWFHPEHTGTSTLSNNDVVTSPWLVGAGKSGLVALWDCSNAAVKNGSLDTPPNNALETYVEPVISWKGHGGRWIADARFLPSPSTYGSNSYTQSSTTTSATSSPRSLLTAGNDGSLCHWDLTTTSTKTGAPRLVNQSGKNLHASGIFSMDVQSVLNGDVNGAKIATGSKDKTLAVSTLDRLNDAPLWRSTFHTAKVGCVSLSQSAQNPLVASASDDGTVAIHDLRQDGRQDGAGNRVVAKLEGIHTKPHTAVWKPNSATVFMTAGLDDTIKLFDLRYVEKPIASYHGHVPGNGKRLKRIHRPTFYNCASSLESFIISGGEDSHAISIFQLGVGMQGDTEQQASSWQGEESLRSVFSQGRLPPDAGDIGSLAVQGRHVAVAVESGEVLLLSPNN